MTKKKKHIHLYLGASKRSINATNVHVSWVLLSLSLYILFFSQIQFAFTKELSPIVCNQALPQSQLAEDIYHDLHGCKVSHSEGAEIQDVPKLEGRWGVWWHWRRMLGEINDRSAHNSILFFSSIFYLKSRKKKVEKGRTTSKLLAPNQSPLRSVLPLFTHACMLSD